jgi:hypothetical protein
MQHDAAPAESFHIDSSYYTIPWYLLYIQWNLSNMVTIIGTELSWLLYTGLGGCMIKFLMYMIQYLCLRIVLLIFSPEAMNINENVVCKWLLLL